MNKWVIGYFNYRCPFSSKKAMVTPVTQTVQRVAEFVGSLVLTLTRLFQLLVVLARFLCGILPPGEIIHYPVHPRVG